MADVVRALTWALTFAGWSLGLLGWLKYFVMNTEQTSPIHFVVMGCWFFLGAMALESRAPLRRQRPSEGKR